MADIARLRIELDEVKPLVWRRVEVPIDIHLDDLHVVIQIVMGWENDHLYEFRRGRTAYGVPDPEWGLEGSGSLSAEETRLQDLLAGRGKVFTYVYDFGDDWRHTIRVEAITKAVPDMSYPHFLEGEGRCPPEDIGGAWGYAAFLAAITDPTHKRHAELLEWSGPFDPTDIGETAIRRELGTLTKPLRRKKKPTVGRATP
jgi:hypothetical protein